MPSSDRRASGDLVLTADSGPAPQRPRAAADRVRHVPFSGTTIPVLDCTVLCVFKAFFARTKDWADIEAMGEAGSVDAGDAVGWGEELLGAGHPSALRLRDTLAPVRGERP